ncbi:hypothetical protein [Streptomyces fagopyri]|uniref:hypothetical protein n=1 Tax=Streptomyces fagopyri TaxID=2662397 RepID=UPI003819875C
MPEHAGLKALRLAISGVSQLVHHTDWSHDTEYEVWRLLQEDHGHWGQTGPAALEQPLERVRSWRRRVQHCWIVIDEETGRQRPIDIRSWLTLYAQWAVARRDAVTGMVDRLRKEMDTVERLAAAHRHPCDSWEFDPAVGEIRDLYNAGTVASVGKEDPAGEHMARHDPAAVRARIACDRMLLDDLLAEKHHVADDDAYTCPAATTVRDGGRNPYQQGLCDCGLDARTVRRVQLLALGYEDVDTATLRSGLWPTGA